MTLIQATPRRVVRATPRYRYTKKPDPAARDILMPGQMGARRFFRPTFTLRWGRRGRGKTLTLVAEGYHFQRAYQARGLTTGNHPWLVAANFQNSHADISRPYLVEELTEYPDWAWNMRLEIDEIALYAHRRKWQLTSNLNLESFITQIRKRSIEPSAATQFPQRLDGDLVEQVDLFIDCDIEVFGCGNPAHTFCAAQRVHDWWGQWTGKTWRKPWPPNPWEYDYFRWFHNCGMFFDSYVTEEIHSPIWLKDAQKNRIRLRQWGEEAPLEEREAEYAERQQQLLIDAHEPDNEVIRREMEGWEQYTPDLTIGKPGEDQLAHFLRQKASRQPGNLIVLSAFLREASNINPNIDSLSELVEFCQKQGWLVRTEDRRRIVYIP